LIEAIEDFVFERKKTVTINDNEMYHNAADRISEFKYRKMFGLSKADMLNEPLEDYLINKIIQKKVDQKEEFETKKTESQIKNVRRRG